MGVVPARVAGVERVVVASPPGPDGLPAPIVLAACALGVPDRCSRWVARAQLRPWLWVPHSVARVDKIVGPGNAYVTEAKRQLNGMVAIDCPAGSFGSPDPGRCIADPNALRAGADCAGRTRSGRGQCAGGYGCRADCPGRNCAGAAGPQHPSPRDGRERAAQSGRAAAGPGRVGDAALCGSVRTRTPAGADARAAPHARSRTRGRYRVPGLRPARSRLAITSRAPITCCRRRAWPRAGPACQRRISCADSPCQEVDCRRRRLHWQRQRRIWPMPRACPHTPGPRAFTHVRRPDPGPRLFCAMRTAT